MPGLKAAQPRSEFGSRHGMSAWWELLIPGGAGGKELRLQGGTELQLLVPVTSSWPVGHPKGGFTHPVCQAELPTQML